MIKDYSTYSSLKRYLLISAIFIFALKFANAQEPAFSQFYAAPLFLNPAMAGGDDNLSAGFNLKTNTNKQLFPYSLSQFTFMVPVRINSRTTVDKYAKNGYIGGLGLTFFNESMGDANELKTTGVSLSTAYFLQVGMSHYLSFGLQFAMIQRTIDYNKLTWGSQYDADMGYNTSITPSFSIDKQKILYPAINFGMTWYHNLQNFRLFQNSPVSFFSGVAISNLNKPDMSFNQSVASTVPMLFKLHGGFNFEVNDYFEVLPNYLLMYQNKENHVNIGTYIVYYFNGKKTEGFKFQLGSWYRLGDSYIASVGCEMKNIVLGISYDLNLSGFQYNNKGVRTVEVSVRYRPSKPKMQLQRNISHPII